MRSISVLLFVFLCLSLSSEAQATFSAEQPVVHLKVGAGIDYWSLDYSKGRKFGPAAWVGVDLWHGLGVQTEMHSLLAGGDLPRFRYIVGEGGPVYTVHHWRKVEPYAKGELGFGSLDTSQPGALHSTHWTWAVGGGVEYRTWRRLWTRADYTYDGYPDFFSTNTHQYHTLNPAGVTVGLTYHLQ